MVTRDSAMPTASAVERADSPTRAAWRRWTYATSIAFAIGWTLVLGKDVHWDAVNYHLYLGFSALNDRFTTDFFAAGTPSYLNPYAYVPLYAMSRAGIPALWMAVVFAAFHALILWATFEIVQVAGQRDRGAALEEFSLLAVALAVLNPLFLQGVGSTAVDISTGVLLVAGWLALAVSIRDGRFAAAAIAGALCGIAAAFKLSNAIFAVAVLPALAFFPTSLRRRGLAVLVFGAACASGFVLVALPWSWRLEQEFGNPVFPFLNQWFKSSDFIDVPLRYERFLPGSLSEFVWRPFDMLVPRGRIHTESRAPDLRYAALMVAIVACGLVWASTTLTRWRRNSEDVQTRGGISASIDSTHIRVLLALLTGLGAAWTLWLLQSGNSRYFIPMACVASATLALVLQQLYRRWPRAIPVAILLGLVMQAVQIGLGSDWKRDGLRWDGAWLPVGVPERFQKQPQLYLSTHFLSGSAFAPSLHPGSGMMNITGFYVLGPGHPGGTRAQALIDRYADRVRLLVPLPNGYSEGKPQPIAHDILAGHVRRFGLRVDFSDCDLLKLEGNLRGAIRRDGDAVRSPWTYFLTCRLVHAPEEALAYARDVREIDALFDRVEDVCPNVFQPRRPVTEQMPFWVRLYNMGTEVQLWIDNGRVQYFSPFRGGEPIDIGSVDDWMKGSRVVDCTRLSAPIAPRAH